MQQCSLPDLASIHEQPQKWKPTFDRIIWIPHGPHMGSYGAIWTPYEFIWVHMSSYGSIWTHMGLYGLHTRPCGPVYGPIWTYMSPCGPIWGHMGPYRPPMDQFVLNVFLCSGISVRCQTWPQYMSSHRSGNQHLTGSPLSAARLSGRFWVNKHISYFQNIKILKYA